MPQPPSPSPSAMKPAAAAVSVPVELVRAIRLIEGDGGPRVVSAVGGSSAPMAQVTLVSSPLGVPGASPAEVLSFSEVGVSITAWDVAATTGGFAGAFVVAKGAKNPVYLAAPGGQQARVSPADSWASYAFPRFVAGTAEMTLTAVSEDRALEIFTGTAGGFGPPHAIVDTRMGLVLRDRHGFAVVYKLPASGAARGAGATPGLLRYARLDAAWNLASTPSSPLGDTLVYELDAVARDARTVIFASTGEGTALVVATGTASGLSAPVVTREAAPAFIGSPAVLLSGATLVLAAIQAPLTKDAQIVTATRPLDAP